MWPGPGPMHSSRCWPAAVDRPRAGQTAPWPDWPRRAVSPLPRGAPRRASRVDGQGGSAGDATPTPTTTTGGTKIETAAHVQNKAAKREWQRRRSLDRPRVHGPAVDRVRFNDARHASPPAWWTAVLAPSDWGRGQTQGHRAREARDGRGSERPGTGEQRRLDGPPLAKTLPPAAVFHVRPAASHWRPMKPAPLPGSSRASCGAQRRGFPPASSHSRRAQAGPLPGPRARRGQ